MATVCPIPPLLKIILLPPNSYLGFCAIPQLLTMLILWIDIHYSRAAQTKEQHSHAVEFHPSRYLRDSRILAVGDTVNNIDGDSSVRSIRTRTYIQSMQLRPVVAIRGTVNNEDTGNSYVAQSHRCLLL